MTPLPEVVPVNEALTVVVPSEGKIKLYEFKRVCTSLARTVMAWLSEVAMRVPPSQAKLAVAPVDAIVMLAGIEYSLISWRTSSPPEIAKMSV